jgi:hypothetical protein
MSKKETTNVGGAQRRTWDVEEYEKRAKERAELGAEEREVVELFYSIKCSYNHNHNADF